MVQPMQVSKDIEVLNEFVSTSRLLRLAAYGLAWQVVPWVWFVASWVAREDSSWIRNDFVPALMALMTFILPAAAYLVHRSWMAVLVVGLVPMVLTFLTFHVRSIAW